VSPDVRFSIVCLLIAAVAVLLGIVWREVRMNRRVIRRLDDVFSWQHRRRTPVATIAGLVAALERGLEQGGLTPEARRAIYVAIDEQLELFFDLDERAISEPTP
jgi:hypothetical protein